MQPCPVCQGGKSSRQKNDLLQTTWQQVNCAICFGSGQVTQMDLKYALKWRYLKLSYLLFGALVILSTTFLLLDIVTFTDSSIKQILIYFSWLFYIIYLFSSQEYMQGYRERREFEIRQFEKMKAKTDGNNK